MSPLQPFNPYMLTADDLRFLQTLETSLDALYHQSEQFFAEITKTPSLTDRPSPNTAARISSIPPAGKKTTGKPRTWRKLSESQASKVQQVATAATLRPSGKNMDLMLQLKENIHRNCESSDDSNSSDSEWTPPSNHSVKEPSQAAASSTVSRAPKSRKYKHPTVFNSPLMQSWSEKNEDKLDPKKITTGSPKQAYWKCLNNPKHPDWQTRIAIRQLGHGCPVCFQERQKTLPSVAESELYASWSEKNKGRLDPKNITIGSKKRAFWKCLKNSEHPHWQTAVVNRKIGKGCPVCAKKKQSTLPSVADSKLYASWSEKNKGLFDPKQLSLGSTLKPYWKCLKNVKHPHWKATVNNIHNGKGCPTCYNKKVDKLPSVADSKIYDLWSEKNKGLFDPKKLSLGSNKMPYWKCLKNTKHPHWKATVKNIHKGHGCPKCAIISRSKTNMK